MNPGRVSTASQSLIPNESKLEHRPFSDPSRLAPGDIFSTASPKKQRQTAPANGRVTGDVPNGTYGTSQRKPEKERGRSGSRRRKQEWKKLLWVPNEGYPDNYTDPATFLSRLQRNPRILPYDFWPLVSDFTVVVQHLCAVAIFICSFIVIYQERSSPITVAGCGSTGTVLGWVFWDFWVGQDDASRAREDAKRIATMKEAMLEQDKDQEGTTITAAMQPSQIGLGLTLQTSDLPTPTVAHSRSQSISSLPSATSPAAPGSSKSSTAISNSFRSNQKNTNRPPSGYKISFRNQARLSTVKSAIIISSVLYGLSPILKSLTKSTSKDSIWALSTWLMLINILFFDYGRAVGVKFPAPLSTNAAVMASTVLASRLSSTTHVFSFVLFSIQVFGLFPLFRRYLRHVSWKGHVSLSVALIVGAGAFMGFTLAPGCRWWKAAIAGAVLWGMGTTLGMGGCSWWFINLQRYKNVVIGPWDPARPVIRGGWD